MSTDIRFTAPVETVAGRKIIRFPEEASSQLSSRGQVAADVTVNGLTEKRVIEPDGRKGHWLPVDTDALPDAPVDITIHPTKDWPEPVVPEDMKGALDEASDIAGQWSDITPMARWEWVRWVGATKNEGTRQRRIDVTVDKLRKGSRRPCCFDLSSCTDPQVAKSGKLIDEG
ncbi:YdeI/OmpD-associated family protein [Corynebacterium sputi]|uniref:YdeI/OmpD-associated family protein n=1 Tax=Corynebacterium sputi TaxID=489915 RepID=UPI0003FF9D58|nr:YdeI/OmpD-associated family protein [Corynebacterium sputi]